MGYLEFRNAAQAYPTKKAGAGVEVLVFDVLDPTNPILGATTGVNYSDRFEQIPIEEAGKSGTDEIVSGAHSGSGSFSAYYTPQTADNMPTRNNFLTKEYQVIERIAIGRPGAGTVLAAYMGVKISDVSGQQGARGAKTMSFQFLYTNRMNGLEWAAITGTL